MKGMATCEVCGRDFPLIFENHYIARNCEKTGVMPALSRQEEATTYDAFDCPHCGSQYVAQERKHRLTDIDEEDNDDCCDCCENDLKEEEN